LLGFHRVNRAIISIEENTFTIRLILEGKALAVGGKAGEFLDESGFVHLKMRGEGGDFRRIQADLSRPAAASGTAIAFVKNRHWRKVLRAGAECNRHREMTEAKQNPSRARGCLFYGLLTAVLVFFGVVAGIYFGTRKAVRYAIETYTTNGPVAIPTVQLPPAQQRSMANALVQQFEAAANHRGPDELVLGEDELNVLIAQSSDLRLFQRRVYLQPQGDELKAYISMPLDQFKPWQEFARKMGGTNYAGRYLNGIAYAGIAVTNGILKLEPRKMVIAAKALPNEFIKQFPWQTLTQPINENTNFHAALERVEAISIKEGKVHVKFRP
jgi:hypothetical protein